jgi:hemolysin activation/secretion protein
LPAILFLQIYCLFATEAVFYSTSAGHFLQKIMLLHRFLYQVLWLGIAYSLSLSAPVLAQSPPPAGAADAVQEAVPRRSNPPDLTPYISPSAPPSLDLPTAPAERFPPAPDVRFPVREIRVLGSNVLESEIEQLTEEYRQRGELTFGELLELRSRITQLYVDNGYITSGAFLPSSQSLADGEVEIQVLEGRLEAVKICLLPPGAGQNHTAEAASELPEQAEQPTAPPPEPDCGSAKLQESYVRSRLARLSSGPVQQQRLEEALQLLQIDPVIEQVRAELTAGSAAGQSILQVEVREAPPFALSLGTDNYQSPSIGSEQFSVQASYANLIGVGDRISASYGITEGLDSFDVGFAVPVNAMNGTISVGYSNDDSLIIESEFEDLEIRSQTETISLGFRQPIIKTPSTEVGLGIGLDWRRSTSFLEDEPFSFSEGPNDGESNVTVIRFSQDWVSRDRDTVLAARSQFSLGVDALDATINDTGTDGRFFAWLGQFQWVQRLSPRWILVSRLSGQLTPDSLLSLERFGYGGVDTLRGYRQNQLVTDNGLLGSVEARFSVLSNSDRLQLISFAELGTGWNNQTPDPETATLASLGLGLSWLITPDLSVRVDYGFPLVDVENEGGSLQDSGFYFSLRYEPF